MTCASRLLALATVAASLLGVGCNSYHYYDIKMQFDQSSLPVDKAGYLQLCQVHVSGADTDVIRLPTADAKGPSGLVACPIGSNFPVLGTFEYATFAESGKLNFAFVGYDGPPGAGGNPCAMGSVSFDAGSTITQAMTMMLTGGPNDCVSHTQQ